MPDITTATFDTPTFDTVTFDVGSLPETQAIARQLADVLQPGTILLLEGNLGSGKTTFVQALGQGLGIQTAIVSPTFTLIDEYTDGRLPLYHIDLYRLEPHQVSSLHLQEYWRGEDFPLGIVAIEWPSKLPTQPNHYLHIELTIIPSTDTTGNTNPDLATDELDLPQTRRICFTAYGDSPTQAIAEMRKGKIKN